MTTRQTFSLAKGVMFCALLALAGVAQAQTDILGAAADPTLTGITIKGTGLQPPTGKPTVSLGSYPLAVISFTNVQITAALPANLKPGTYTLEVTANGAEEYEMTIGAAGPAGPAGAAGPQGPQGPSGNLSLPFSGSVTNPFPALLIANTAGSAIVGVSSTGLGVTGQGGVSGATASAGVSGIGGGGSGVANGGPGFSGTGGNGAAYGGDGIDATGGLATGSEQYNAGSGISATGGYGAFDAYGGWGVNSLGGDADYAGAGIYSQGGNTIAGCVQCVGGPGGIFTGGQGHYPGAAIVAYGGAGDGIYASGPTAGDFDWKRNGYRELVEERRFFPDRPSIRPGEQIPLPFLR